MPLLTFKVSGLEQQIGASPAPLGSEEDSHRALFLLWTLEDHRGAGRHPSSAARARGPLLVTGAKERERIILLFQELKTFGCSVSFFKSHLVCALDF